MQQSIAFGALKVWSRLKCEHLQEVGAFKIRGGLIHLGELKSKQPNIRGVISATRGNHGQSVAHAATRLGIRSVIVVPHGNSVEKNAAMRAWGAELVEQGEDFQEAREWAAEHLVLLTAPLLHLRRRPHPRARAAVRRPVRRSV